MSDFHKLRQKTVEGNDWRGSINIVIDGDELELTVRQLQDPEFFEVMSMVDTDELQALREDLPEGMYDEYEELQEKDELTDEEEDRLVELEEELANTSTSLFDAMSTDTFQGIVRAGKYAVVPDQDDLNRVFDDHEWVREKEAEYGEIKTPDDCFDPLKDEMVETLDNATNFTSFNVGIVALMETIGDAENL